MTAESARKKLVRGEHRQVYPPKVVADDATDREGLELPCIETIDRTNAGKSGAQERVSDRTRLNRMWSGQRSTLPSLSSTCQPAL